MVVHMATDATEFCGRKPRIDMIDHGPRFRGDMVQDINKRGEPQIRDLAAPQRFHATQVQGLQGDVVILLTQLPGQVPVEALAEMGHTAMHTGQMLPSFAAIVGPFDFPGEVAVRLGNLAQSVFEGLWRLDLSAIIASEIGRQPKVEACAFTRHGCVTLRSH